MLMRGEYLVENIFPKALGTAIQDDYIRTGSQNFYAG